MESNDRPEIPEGSDSGSGLPHPPRELRRELLRRLELLHREIRALDTARTHQVVSRSVESLRAMEDELRSRLDSDFDPATWPQTRAEIIAIWRRYRRAFERLAAESAQQFPARSGRRDRGPRW